MATHFEQSTFVHYQAISHTDNSNLKFTVFLDLIIYIKYVKKAGQRNPMWQCDKNSFKQIERGGKYVPIYWWFIYHCKKAFFQFKKILLMLVTQNTKIFKSGFCVLFFISRELEVPLCSVFKMYLCVLLSILCHGNQKYLCVLCLRRTYVFCLVFCVTGIRSIFVFCV